MFLLLNILKIIKMKQSRNNIIIQKDEDNCIIANTLTRAVVELNSAALSDVKKGDIKDLKELTNEQFNEIINMGFLIPKDLNEDEFLNHILQRERLSGSTLVTYLMYSTACNFDCKYCYEKEQVGAERMNEETIKNLISWYTYRLENGDYKVCNIILFGGEPLLFPDFFLDFLQKLQQIALKFDVSLNTHIVSNGYLLTNNIVTAYKPFNLTEIDVTIDGPPEIHNVLRPLKGVKESNTFDTILNNLVSISTSFPEIILTCRISFNKTNIQSIPKLLDIIKESDKSGNIRPYFAHITQTSSQIAKENSFCSQNIFSDDTELADCYIFLYREAKKRGFEIPTFITLGPCMFFSENSFAISPNGDLFKCLDMVGFKDLSVGNVDFPLYYKSNYYDMVKAKKIDSCIQTDCPYIPICGSGCVIEPWLKYNDYNKVVCRRSMLEKIHKALLLEKF